MSLRLDGINPLSYMGVKPSQPPNLMVKQAAPTANDFQNINIGTFWLVYPAEQLWFLISVAGGTATWVQLYPAGGGGGGASQFPTNGSPANEAGGILNIFGAGNIVTAGGGNTVTISLAGTIPNTFHSDDGNAVPSGGVLNILGGTNINTSGAGNTITVNLDDSVTLTGTLQVDGNTTLESGLTLSTLTNGVLQSNGSGVVTATNGSNGQVLIGGGNAPVWANLTSTGGTVVITNGVNSINLEATGGGGGGSIVFEAYQNNFVILTNGGAGTGGATTYNMGTQDPMTIDLNAGSAFYPGDGAGTPASFTAPVNGRYFFSFFVRMSRGGGTSPSISTTSAIINTPTRSFGQTGNNGFTTTAGSVLFTNESACCNTVAQLNMGDVVTFTAGVVASPLTSNPILRGVITPYSLIPGITMASTFVTGYLISEF
jgi:hypothetical protein